MENLPEPDEAHNISPPLGAQNEAPNKKQRKKEKKAAPKKRRKAGEADEPPALRLEKFEGFLKALDAMQGVRTVYITATIAPPFLLLPPGTIALYLSAKDEQNRVARCYIALDAVELDLQAQRQNTLDLISARIDTITDTLDDHGLEVERGEWL